MASISPPTFPPPSTRSDSKFTFPNPRLSSRLRPPSTTTLNSYSLSSSNYLSRFSDSALCRCTGKSDSPSSSDNNLRWDSVIQGVVRNAIRMFNHHMSSYLNSQSRDDDDEEEKAGSDDVVEFVEDADEVWDWDRWSKHFNEVDEQERILAILKTQLVRAIGREDYEDASRLKVAIAAAATNDTVGRVMYHLDRAIKDERYGDAALIRDSAGAGLVGWWAGISENAKDPYGRIIRITAEHGRYMAKSYSPRQLATASAGIPLFEIFLTVNPKGDYKQQAVYLRRTGASQDFSIVSPKSFGPIGTLNPLDSTEDNSDLFASLEDSGDGEDRDDDSDEAERFSGFDNILRDMVPGVKVKVLKVTTPEKVDRDVISKVIEQIMEEEEEDADIELESIDTEDDDEGEGDQLVTEIDLDTGGGPLDVEGGNEVSVKVFVDGLSQKGSDNAQSKKLIRQPAKLEKRDRLSFSFSVEKDDSQKLSDKGQSPLTKKAKLRGPSHLSHVVFDLAKSIGKGKIPMKVLKDVNELINLTLKQAQKRLLLSGSTTFNRIEIPTSLDPLSGLYIGTHGLYSSEVIHLRRKFGQWQAEGGTKEPKKLEFYEYVEAMKLTGDPNVPAGQVAFRAKVGKRFQLPHKGIIPEEFGVVARYKGQGRLAEPGFINPRWVDGELVVLDGKYIKGGPVVGFLYWAPEYHFLVFFNRLRLQE